MVTKSKSISGQRPITTTLPAARSRGAALQQTPLPAEQEGESALIPSPSDQNPKTKKNSFPRNRLAQQKLIENAINDKLNRHIETALHLHQNVSETTPIDDAESIIKECKLFFSELKKLGPNNDKILLKHHEKARLMYDTLCNANLFLIALKSDANALNNNTILLHKIINQNLEAFNNHTIEAKKFDFLEQIASKILDNYESLSKDCKRIISDAFEPMNYLPSLKGEMKHIHTFTDKMLQLHEIAISSLARFHFFSHQISFAPTKVRNAAILLETAIENSLDVLQSHRGTLENPGDAPLRHSREISQEYEKLHYYCELLVNIINEVPHPPSFKATGTNEESLQAANSKLEFATSQLADFASELRFQIDLYAPPSPAKVKENIALESESREPEPDTNTEKNSKSKGNSIGLTQSKTNNNSQKKTNNNNNNTKKSDLKPASASNSNNLQAASSESTSEEFESFENDSSDLGKPSNNPHPINSQKDFNRATKHVQSLIIETDDAISELNQQTDITSENPFTDIFNFVSNVEKIDSLTKKLLQKAHNVDPKNFSDLTQDDQSAASDFYNQCHFRIDQLETIRSDLRENIEPHLHSFKSLQEPKAKHLEKLFAAHQISKIEGPYQLLSETPDDHIYRFKIYPKEGLNGEKYNPIHLHAHTNVAMESSKFQDLAYYHLKAAHLKSMDQANKGKKWEQTMHEQGDETAKVHRSTVSHEFFRKLMNFHFSKSQLSDISPTATAS